MDDKRTIQMYGGIWGGLVPLFVIIIGHIAQSISARG